MSIIKREFGKTKDNINVNIFTITNKSGMKAEISTYGGTIVSLTAPDKEGNFDDIVLGYDTIESYENGDKFFGALIGRCGNRIQNGKFTLNDKEYSLVINDGPNHLHGGTKGFDKVIWNAEILSNEYNQLKLSYFSKDGEEGYPGNLNVTVIYTLTDDNSLEIHYHAISDSDTIVNLTNHSYFNLGGHASGTILDHELMIAADTFTVNDEFSIPTGEIGNVSDTPMDFRSSKNIGKDINSDYEQIKFGCGYDHNWILNSNGDISKLSAKLIDKSKGRVMDMYTTSPGVQFYSANFLDGKGTSIGKNNTPYVKRSGVCLETQFVPNAINNNNFASPLLKANEEYNHTTIYKFSTL